jgi:caspase domain-containing protein
MVRENACRSVLITVGLLLVLTTLGSAQSRKRGQQDPRGVTVVPAMPTASPPERRVALVIGNSAYQYTAPLKNPANDAQDIARVLKELQFHVMLKTDVHLDAMADAIFQFGERLKGGGGRAFLLFRSWHAGERGELSDPY